MTVNEFLKQNSTIKRVIITDDDEVTTCFVKSGNFFISFSSVMSLEEAVINFRALENVDMTVITAEFKEKEENE